MTMWVSLPKLFLVEKIASLKVNDFSEIAIKITCNFKHAGILS